MIWRICLLLKTKMKIAIVYFDKLCLTKNIFSVYFFYPVQGTREISWKVLNMFGKSLGKM